MTAEEVEKSFEALRQALVRRVIKLLTEAAAADTSLTAQYEGATVAQAKNVQEQNERRMSVVTEGDKIIIPEGVSLDEAILWIQRKKEAEQTPVACQERFFCYPLEGAVALGKALEALYGFTAQVNSGPKKDKPPVMLNVEVAFNSYIQVPWSRIEVPKLKGWIEPQVDTHDGRSIFVLTGRTIKKHEAEFKRLCDEMRRIIHEESLYKGKAIKVSFPDVTQENFNPLTDAPKFMDISRIRPEQLVFSDDVRARIEVGLFTPIIYRQSLRYINAPFKRGVLLYGPYGTGKTMCASVCARFAADNNITFVHLENVADLPRAMDFVRGQYEPAVVFAEDVDRVTSGERSESLDRILNTVDGIHSKDREVMIVVTTNHLGRIHEAMLRPGRFDDIIHITPPDPQAVSKLIRVYGGALIEETADLAHVGDLLHGQIPAVVREVIERAKYAALFARKGATEAFAVTAEDLTVAAEWMLSQRELVDTLKRGTPLPETPAKSLIEAIGREVRSVVREEGGVTVNE